MVVMVTDSNVTYKYVCGMYIRTYYKYIVWMIITWYQEHIWQIKLSRKILIKNTVIFYELKDTGHKLRSPFHLGKRQVLRKGEMFALFLWGLFSLKAESYMPRVINSKDLFLLPTSFPTKFFFSLKKYIKWKPRPNPRGRSFSKNHSYYKKNTEGCVEEGVVEGEMICSIFVLVREVTS